MMFPKITIFFIKLKIYLSFKMKKGYSLAWKDMNLKIVKEDKK